MQPCHPQLPFQLGHIVPSLRRLDTRQVEFVAGPHGRRVGAVARDLGAGAAMIPVPSGVQLGARAKEVLRARRHRGDQEARQAGAADLAAGAGGGNAD